MRNLFFLFAFICTFVPAAWGTSTTLTARVDTAFIKAGGKLDATYGRFDTLVAPLGDLTGLRDSIIVVSRDSISTVYTDSINTRDSVVTIIRDSIITVVTDSIGEGLNDGGTITGPIIIPTRDWTQLWDASGCGNCVATTSFAVYDDSLYFCDDRGTFGYVGYYNGTDVTLAWYTAGAGVRAMALIVFNDFLFLGKGDGSGKGDIFRYDRVTHAWTEEGTDLADAVIKFIVWNNVLYAGTAVDAGSATIQSSATGLSWSASYEPGATVREVGYDMVVHDGLLYATVRTTTDGSDIVFNAGGGWQSLGSPAPSDMITALASYDGKLWAGSSTASQASVYYYDETSASWTTAKLFGAEYQTVYAMFPYKGRLYVGLGDPSTQTASVKLFDGIAYNDSVLGYDVTTISRGFGGFGTWNDELFAGFGNEGSSTGTNDIWVYYTNIWGTGADDGSPGHFTKPATFHDSTYFEDGVTFDGHVIFSAGASPTSWPVDKAVLWSSEVSGTAELWAADEAGNAAPLTANLQTYPGIMAPSETYPYVTLRRQEKEGIRTWIALNRMAELVQELSHEMGYLEKDKRIIYHEQWDPKSRAWIPYKEDESWTNLPPGSQTTGKPWWRFLTWPIK